MLAARRQRETAPELVQDKASTLSELVVALIGRTDHRCAPGVVEQALRYADRRAADHRLESCVVVHGDPHPDNALRVLHARAGAPHGYVLVDPDGFLADPAYDVGVALRDYSGALLAADPPSTLRTWCRVAADRAGLDPQVVWEWAYLERVSTGLYVLDLGSEAVGRPFLDVAALLLD